MNKRTFEKNPLLEKFIDNTYNNIKDDDYGVSYSWGELKEIASENTEQKPSQQQLYYILNKVNLLLMLESKYLKTIIGFGKRILKPNEHVLESRKIVKQASKRYRKAGSIIGSTNMDKLNQDEKKDVITAANKWRTLEMFHNELIKTKKIKDESLNKQSTKFILDYLELFGGKQT